MEMIRKLQINNYKSIKRLDLDCSRINVFVGEPNVGKSNILEALDLSYLSWLLHGNNSLKVKNRRLNIKEYFRVKSVADLFHLGNLTEPISIHYSGFCPDDFIQFNEDSRTFEWRTSNGSVTGFDKNFQSTEENQDGNFFYESPIHPYKFKDNVKFHDSGNYYNVLMPPYGNNLGGVIEYNPDLRNFIEELLHDSPVEFALDKSTKGISFYLKLSKGVVYTLPFQSLADTLRRILFYVAAIRTNNAYAITLEEPEAHSFPRYVSLLADEIIKKEDRQFFIATHSPYLLNNLIENAPKSDLAVFVCGYNKEKLQTTTKRLSNDELSELLDYGVDIFFNINRYLDDRIEYSA